MTFMNFNQSANQIRSLRLILGTLFRENAAVLALGLAILTIRFSLVIAYASSEPFWDEWDATIDQLLRAYSTHTLSFFDLFKTHNEHTIFFTRLVNLGALWLNHGQFDNLPVVFFNQILFAVAWVFVARILIVHGHAAMSAFPILFGLSGIVPLGSENILTGFQNAFYFLILGSALTIWLASKPHKSTIGSWMGFVLATFGVCVCMGSGFFAPLAAMAVVLARARAEPMHRRGLLVKAAICGAAVLLGFALLMRTGRLPSADTSILATFANTLSCLAWPYGYATRLGAWAFLPYIMGACLCLPFLGFSLALITRRTPSPAIDYFAFGLGLWVLAQIAAMAASRHADGASLSPRYFDVLIFWPVFSIFYLFRVVQLAIPRISSAAFQRLARCFPELLAAALAGCIVVLIQPSIEFVSARGAQFAEQSRRVASYLRTSDAGVLISPNLMDLPYPSRQRLQSLLDDPLVRRSMPPDLRQPLPLTPSAIQSGNAFIPHGEYVTTPKLYGLNDFGSYTGIGNASAGEFQSAPMQTDYPYVVIGLAGYLPDAHLSLHVGCVPQSSCPAVEAAPNQAPRESWKYLALRVPDRDFALYALDSSPSLWFAFTAPVEAGALSAFTIRMETWTVDEKQAIIVTLSGAIAWLLFFACNGTRSGLPSRNADDR